MCMFNKILPLKFRAYHILPLTYDDSLSYYETNCKLHKSINECIKYINDLDPRVIEIVTNFIANSFEKNEIYMDSHYSPLTKDLSFVLKRVEKE